MLYDRAQTWQEYREMAADGLLRPEYALAWYFGLPHETEADLAAVRSGICPQRRREVKSMEKKPDTAPAPYAAGTGSAAVLPDAEALARMSYRERLAFKRDDPEAYERLRRER